VQKIGGGCATFHPMAKCRADPLPADLHEVWRDAHLLWAPRPALGGNHSAVTRGAQQPEVLANLGATKVLPWPEGPVSLAVTKVPWVKVPAEGRVHSAESREQRVLQALGCPWRRHHQPKRLGSGAVS